MIRVNKLTDYAIAVASKLSVNDAEVRSVAEISKSTFIPEPTVAKILKLLTKSGIVLSKRGINGGYLLGKDIKDVSVADMVQAIEGPIMLTSCVDVKGKAPKDVCMASSVCMMRARWNKVNQAVIGALEAVSVKDMFE